MAENTSQVPNSNDSFVEPILRQIMRDQQKECHEQLVMSARVIGMEFGTHAIHLPSLIFHRSALWPAAPLRPPRRGLGLLTAFPRDLFLLPDHHL